MNGKKTGQVLAALNFMILMAALGASDSLRGIFAPAFQEHFSLNASSLSLIIVVSYIGNLIFLCFGGQILDAYPKKKVTLSVIALWMGALILYLTTDHFILLLVGMFFSMGASTLLNTTVNILTPALFVTAPGMMVNIFFFVQGIGTSGSQNLAGRAAGSYQAFRMVNLILLVMGIISFLLLLKVEVPDDREKTGSKTKKNGREKKDGKAKTSGGENKVPWTDIMKADGFWMLVLIFGLYFVAEHGILNWLVSYGTESLGLTSAKAAFYLSLFFGGMTVGRLVFAPAVSRFGAFKSILFFGGAGTLLFTAGILSGTGGLWMLSLSGLAMSILYPTLVFMINYIFPANMLGGALGMVISVATLFDIGFNFLFGRLIDRIGFSVSFLIIPACMVGFYISYLVFYRRYKALQKSNVRGEHE